MFKMINYFTTIITIIQNFQKQGWIHGFPSRMQAGSGSGVAGYTAGQLQTVGHRSHSKMLGIDQWTD